MRWGAWRLWSDSWQQLKYGPIFNAAVLSHIVFELILSQALEWADCGLPKLFKDQGHPQQNLYGNTVIHTCPEGNWQLLNFLFLPLKGPPSKRARSSALLRSHGCDPFLDFFPQNLLLALWSPWGIAVHEEKEGTHGQLTRGCDVISEFRL